MDRSKRLFPVCPTHGKPTKRDSCKACNAAYMRAYLKQRRRRLPGQAMWERARKRAQSGQLAFALTKDAIFVPRTCPALGIALTPGSTRSAQSPSLDRIEPRLGYVPDNVRVISDRANRLKGNCSLQELRRRAIEGAPELRGEYEMIASYLERELLLSEIRKKARQEGRAGEEWAKLAFYLNRLFRKSLTSTDAAA
jgi:hypothetical protein